MRRRRQPGSDHHPGQGPERAKRLELQGWSYPKHLAGRAFSIVVHGDAAGAGTLRRSLSDWLTDMHLIPGAAPAVLDRYVGYYEPYATSHDALDDDPALLEEVRNAARSLMATITSIRTSVGRQSTSCATRGRNEMMGDSMTEHELRVLGISGSLRRQSYNTAALRAAQELAPPGMRIETADISAIPVYNEDVRERGFPPAVELVPRTDPPRRRAAAGDA